MVLSDSGKPMSVAIVTGSSGLIGSESVRVFDSMGFDVVGIDNDMRSYFFGPEATTKPVEVQLQKSCPHFRPVHIDIRDAEAVSRVFARYGRDISLVIHTAAQPSHDWAAREPLTDFGVNATGTLHLLEATRQHCPDAVFIFTSTNKVYGDTPNRLPLVEMETRWEIESTHPYFEHGIDETMSIDQTKHSLFGASKVAADVLVQEYGRYFGMKTGVFRCGCIVGAQQTGVELHGFLSHLVKCAKLGHKFRIFGFAGKQLRDILHARDLVDAFALFFKEPHPADVYNIGGGRFSSCSLLEAIRLCEDISGRPIETTYVESHRSGDHIWWISDTRRFERTYPEWKRSRMLRTILLEMAST